MFKKNIWSKFLYIFYIFAAIIMFFMLVFIFDTNILHLKVDTAVVNAPIETITAPTSGYIQKIYKLTGESFKKGDPLIKIENLNIENNLFTAKVDARNDEIGLVYHQKLLQNEINRLKIYKKIGQSRIAEARALVKSANLDMQTMHSQLNRLKTLHEQRYISDTEWDKSLDNYLISKENMHVAKSKLSLQDHAVNSINTGLYFTGNKLEGVKEDLLASIYLDQEKLKLAKQKIKFQQELQNQLTIKAPFTGTVQQVLRSVGNTVDNSKSIILIKKDNVDMQVVAWLTQSEAAKISTQQKVKFVLPSSGKFFTGTVLSLNRAEGFLDAVKANYQWSDLDSARSAIAVIKINPDEIKSFNQKATAGTPVIVYFKRWSGFFFLP